VIDPIRTLRAELAAEPAVSAITTRIRRGDAAPEDKQGPGSYVPFVVLVRLDSEREVRAPVGVAPIAARCYAATREGAVALWGAISDALNNRGPRIANGVLIHRSVAPSDGGDEQDPDTGQPLVTGLIRLHFATQPVA
jgi:hypothetical protein